MGCALALPLVVALAAGATADVALGVRSEGRTSALAPADLPTETRTALSAEPHAAAVLDAWRLRLGATYAARLWTSDVEAQRSPLVNHTVDARIETRQDRAWRAEATASATRGSTDPLADLSRTTAGAASTAGAAQLPATQPLRYEALRTGARGDLALDLRTTLAAGGTWSASRGADDDARALLPPQRALALDASVAHRVTERDTVRAAGTAGRTSTDAPEGTRTGAFSTASATWRRRLTPRLDGWLGAGAALTYEDAPPASSRRDLLPVGEAGLARGGEDVRVAVELAARVAPFVDRFTGDVRTMADVRCGVRWRATERLSVAGSASGGARTDGETAVAAADLRLSWALRPRLGLEAGVLARWQHERRPELPSFFEGGVVAAVTYETGPLFRPDVR